MAFLCVEGGGGGGTTEKCKSEGIVITKERKMENMLQLTKARTVTFMTVLRFVKKHPLSKRGGGGGVGRGECLSSKEYTIT